MPAVTGILETCLYVADLGRARLFFAKVFAFPVLFEDERMTAYDLGTASVLILFVQGGTLEPVQVPGGVIPAHDSSGSAHVAFAIPAESLGDWRERLRTTGTPIESEVLWPAGGTSLYFRDADGHLLELSSPGLWRNYPADLRKFA